MQADRKTLEDELETQQSVIEEKEVELDELKKVSCVEMALWVDSVRNASIRICSAFKSVLKKNDENMKLLLDSFRIKLPCLVEKNCVYFIFFN